MSILNLFKLKPKRWCPMCAKRTKQECGRDDYYRCSECDTIFKTCNFKREKRR